MGSTHPMVGFTNNKQLPSGPASAPPRPANIVYFVTDDQDQMLGGSFPTTAPGMATPLPKVKIDRNTLHVRLGCERPASRYRVTCESCSA